MFHNADGLTVPKGVAPVNGGEPHASQAAVRVAAACCACRNIPAGIAGIAGCAHRPKVFEGQAVKPDRGVFS